MARLKDMTGKTFGEWTVLKRGPNTERGATRWICQCSKCEQLKLVRGSHLREGVSTKCKECHNRTFNLRHGQHQSKTYGVWEAMIQRCTNSKDKHFHNYGGRGITVCESWREDFLNFWSDMGDKPKDLTLDRIDNEQGYCLQNCKWRSRQEQQSNTRKSHRPGYVYGTWKLIENLPYSKQSIFECIHCSHKWTSQTDYITSGGAADCKCIRS